jgi:S-adenosylmethionine-diacylglycerol 3-amino-3-carboxypropyl transferase
MRSEVAQKSDFSIVRYAQCWEDADVLLQALQVQAGKTYLSIASAGDNALALLACGPRKVVALDLSQAQLACLELRVAAYRTLAHPELLELIGSTASERRPALYARCRMQLSGEARAFWDERIDAIARGIGAAGKFEDYFALFRSRVLPMLHSRRTVGELLEPKDAQRRAEFYDRTWDSWRWRMLFRVFFSRTVMGRFGRDPRFFDYVDGAIGDRLLARSRHALVDLEPADNPYLHWILTGRHGDALPFALRAENFERIRANLDRLEWYRLPLESYLQQPGVPAFDGANLSDIFEYMSAENYVALLEQVAGACGPGARLVYWNMMVPRSRPAVMVDRLLPLTDEAARLHAQDKAFFYSALVIEQVRA